jgi:acetyl-CoA C-acetyltransferase
MPVKPRTPVLVAHGQVNHREAAQENTLEPVDLMAAAAREAADARLLEAIDSIRVVNLLSVYYRDPANSPLATAASAATSHRRW